MREIGRNRILAAAAIGTPVIVAAVLIPARSQLNAGNNALILVVAVVAVAVSGSRLAAAVAALAAALSFDLFLTRPYYSLRITHRDDIITDVLLLVVALVVGDVAARGRAHRARSHKRGDEVASLHGLTELVAEGEGPDFVAMVAAGELNELLHLRDRQVLPTHRGNRPNSHHPQRGGPHWDGPVGHRQVRPPDQGGRPSRSEPRDAPRTFLVGSYTVDPGLR